MNPKNINEQCLNFPIEGVQFRDITGITEDGIAMSKLYC